MKKYFLPIVLLFTILISTKNANCQSLAGGTGLITIPSAFSPSDGEMTVGSFFVDKKYLDYSDRKNNCMVYYANLTFLPFLELNFRIIRMLDFHGPDYTVDRVPSVRLHLLKESSSLPAICLGVHDFGSVMGGVDAIHFNALYLVASKSFNLNYPFLQSFDLHLGYSSTIMKAYNYQYDGVFGGTSLSFNQYFRLMLEFDSRRINAGAQLVLFKHLYATAGLLRFDSFSGGLSYKFIL